MTFSVANDDALLGSSYFKMGGRVNWDWPLGNLDLPVNISNTNQSSDNLYINIGILSDLEDFHTGQFINILISEETEIPFNENLENKRLRSFRINYGGIQNKDTCKLERMANDII